MYTLPRHSTSPSHAFQTPTPQTSIARYIYRDRKSEQEIRVNESYSIVLLMVSELRRAQLMKRGRASDWLEVSAAGKE